VGQWPHPFGELRGEASGLDRLLGAALEILRLLLDLPTVTAREDKGQQAGLDLSASCHRGRG
jgi:hypothetical protein